jgi:anti-sigma regulatory factor (Ser/Thr protein kinase)
LLTIPADTARQAEVRALVRAEAAAAGATDEETADLGYEGRPGEIVVAIERDGASFSVRIRDGAPPFDPRTHAEPRLDLPIEQRPLGGMGIHLARALTDGIDHRILPEGGNEVTVTKRLGTTERGG